MGCSRSHVLRSADDLRFQDMTYTPPGRRQGGEIAYVRTCGPTSDHGMPGDVPHQSSAWWSSIHADGKHRKGAEHLNGGDEYARPFLRRYATPRGCEG